MGKLDTQQFVDLLVNPFRYILRDRIVPIIDLHSKASELGVVLAQEPTSIDVLEQLKFLTRFGANRF
jgi:hypothetical protein